MRHVRKSRSVKSRQTVNRERSVSLLTNIEISNASSVASSPDSNGAAKKRAKNVIDALFNHFCRWQPEILDHYNNGADER